MKNKIWIYIISVLCIIGGVYLIISPEQSFSGLVYYIGLIALISGVIKLLSAFFIKDNLSMPGSYLFSGTINIIFGIILMNNTGITIKIIPVLLGIWLIVNSLSGLGLVLNLKSNNNVIDNKFLITNIIKFILGIIFLATPIVSVIFTGWVVGIVLISTGIYLIITNSKTNKIYKVKVK